MSENYVVVGGSKGMGLEIVKQLAAAGRKVWVLSRTADSLDGFSGVNHVNWDAAAEEFPTDALPNELSGLVYCPGSLNLKSFRGLKPEIFLDDFNINVVGAVKSIQACMKALKSKRGNIVLFSTVAVERGMFAHASIAASKGAIEGLTRSLANELAPEIRVNCIAPALTDTSLTEKFFANDEKAAALAEKYPLKRTGTVDDMANAAMFLLGEQSGWVTGQTLGVDGGMGKLSG